MFWRFRNIVSTMTWVMLSALMVTVTITILIIYKVMQRKIKKLEGGYDDGINKESESTGDPTNGISPVTGPDTAGSVREDDKGPAGTVGSSDSRELTHKTDGPVIGREVLPISDTPSFVRDERFTKIFGEK